MIMNNSSGIFQTIIPLMSRIKAETFRRYQSQGSKAKQVYLNTLAVSAVDSYLNFIGWSTNLEDSDSWNPVLQTMMDVADLKIPSYGKLECRVVLTDQDLVNIPPEVWSGRIGYIVVRLNKSLTKATLLGFVPQVKQVELPLSQLETLTKFPAYLSQQKHATPTQTTSLSKWFSGVLDQGWQHLEELFTPTIAFDVRSPQNRGLQYRSPQQLANQTENQLASDVNGVKFIQLGENTDYNVALILNIEPRSSEEFNISITVYNNHSVGYLPEGLDLVILDEVGRPVMNAQANEIKTLEFCFSGKLGEGFSVEISLDEHDVVENFII